MGFFRTKARKLHALCAYLHRYRDDVSRLRALGAARLRSELLAVHGIGPETADAIMLYAVGIPTFVVDAYARRIFSRLGEPSANGSYPQFQRWLIDGLPPDAELLGEYHALLVRHGREVCLADQPRCEACCLRPACATAKLTPRFGRSPYPLIDPIMIPLTKYLCKNGYTRIIGMMVTAIAVAFTDSSVGL